MREGEREGEGEEGRQSKRGRSLPDNDKPCSALSTENPEGGNEGTHWGRERMRRSSDFCALLQDGKKKSGRGGEGGRRGVVDGTLPFPPEDAGHSFSCLTNSIRDTNVYRADFIGAVHQHSAQM